MKNTFTLLTAIIFASVDFCRASVTVVWSNSGGDVVASYSGTLDLTGYSSAIFVSNTTDVRLGPLANVFRGNVPQSASTHLTKPFDAYVDSGLTVPNRFGTFNGSEQAFGFYADRGAFPSELYVPPGYVSGSPIHGEAVFANTTVFNMFGTGSFHTTVFNDGINTVTFFSVPEPSSALLSLSGFAVVLLRRRRTALPRGIVNSNN
jgi:hypothetical protein